MADVEWAYQIYNMMLRSFVRQYYGQAYSKFRISRTPQESLVFFFKN
jgi:hypothetical protein